MEAIKFTTKTIEVAVFAWPCPGCGMQLESRQSPADWVDEAYCSDCQDKRYEECKAGFIRKFKENHNHLIGATVSRVDPDMDGWYDYGPEDAEVLTIIIEKDGLSWRIQSRADLAHLVVTERL